MPRVEHTALCKGKQLDSGLGGLGSSQVDSIKPDSSKARSATQVGVCEKMRDEHTGRVESARRASSLRCYRSTRTAAAHALHHHTLSSG
jgi:hypothetical protein